MAAGIPSSLRSGDIKSCGCYRAPEKTRMDLTGQKISTLTVIEEDRSRPRKLGGHRYWICRCDACGRVKSMSQSHLSGNHLARSCGCVRKKTIYPLPDIPSIPGAVRVWIAPFSRYPDRGSGAGTPRWRSDRTGTGFLPGSLFSCPGAYTYTAPPSPSAHTAVR